MSEQPDRIDQEIRAYYGAQSLDAGQLSRLQETVRASARQPRFQWKRLALAAVVLLMVGISWRVVRWQMREQLSQTVVAQIAQQHLEPFHPQFDVEDFTEVKAKMVQLDFTPIEPQRCKQSDYRVAGASYATLHGQKVAQIRLAYVDGPPVTLYEMRADQFPGLREDSVTVNGTPVTLWYEDGLLMAMAGTPTE